MITGTAVAFSKVLLVSGSANFSTRDVWDGYRIALEEMGVEVIPYPTFSFLKVLSADSVCSDIIGTALNVRQNIDGVIFVDGLYFRGERTRVPESIRRAGIPTVLIATDDPYVPLPDSESLYTHRFSNEIHCARDGAWYLPTATLPLPRLPPNPHYDYDVCFVGTLFEDRYPLMTEVAQYCERRRIRLLIAGKLTRGDAAFRDLLFTEVLHGRIDTAQKLELYTRSKLVLNLFRECRHPADSPSPRVFEVTGLGQAALLSGPMRREVRDIFRDSVYHFHDAASVMAAIHSALENDAQRLQKVVAAREITEAGHLYQHRAASLISTLRATAEPHDSEFGPADRIAWIIGCGRTGSTWLAEMLAEIPAIRRWHEPYFGRFFRHLQERPEDLDRASSFFSTQHQHVWLNGLRDLFLKMVQERYPQLGRHALMVKEVNTPEIYPWLNQLFPEGRIIHLIRDPYDTLDSYLDLQQPGSWNTQFGDSDQPLSEANARRTAEHICSTTTAAWHAFQRVPAERRLEIRYEDLLQRAPELLQQCGRIVDIEVTDEAAATAAAKHHFDTYKETGEGKFRRLGKAGVWQQSTYFTAEVRRIAGEVLGPLRSRLGYAEPAVCGVSDSAERHIADAAPTSLTASPE